MGELFSDNNKCLLSSPSIVNCLSDCEESVSVQYVMLASNCGGDRVLLQTHTHTHTTLHNTNHTLIVLQNCLLKNSKCLLEFSSCLQAVQIQGSVLLTINAITNSFEYSGTNASSTAFRNFDRMAFNST